MPNRRISQAWETAATSLIDQVEKASEPPPKQPPTHLFHLTDCNGLIGILKDKTLWASLATSLNDRSEVTYGVKLALELFSNRTVTATNFSLADMNEPLAEQLAESRVFIVSFCASLNLAGQWLHYGRSGSGVAVGFYTDRLPRDPYTLYPIAYKPEEQVELIRSLITVIDNALAKLLPTLDSDAERDRLKKLAADLAAVQLWMLSPRLKHPSFEAENEWRLIAHEPSGLGAPRGKRPAGDTHFRATAGRVVPYKKITFKSLPAFEIVLGASCPMPRGDLGVLALMDVALKARLTVRESDVPVRA